WRHRSTETGPGPSVTNRGKRERKSMVMRQDVSGTTVMLMVLLVGAVLLLWPPPSFADPPTVGPDCGAGASIVGIDAAGKVTLGTGASNTCTLAFTSAWMRAPSCSAVNETNGGGDPAPIGAVTTTTTLRLGG